jgi:hypothetical protein
MSAWEIANAGCGVFLLFVLPALVVWMPIFAVAYWHRPFAGSLKGYALAWIATALGTAMLLALLGVIEEIARR